MKYSSTQLKNLLKEAIKELIAEGAFDSVVSNVPSVSAPQQQHSLSLDEQAHQKERLRRLITEDPSEFSSQPSRAVPSQDVKEFARNLVGNLTSGMENNSSKNILESILMDTATTTLLEQGEMPGFEAPPRPEDKMLERIIPNGDKNHWAKLAFAKK